MTVQEMIQAEALRQGVEPALALAVAQVESGFNQGARGQAGEIGVFQLLPSTARSLNVDPYDLASNIRGGVTYLRQMLSICGREDLALMAYNSGPDACTRGYIPDSSRAYAAMVLGAKGMFAVTATATPPAPAAGWPTVPSPGFQTGGLGGDWVTGALVLGGAVLLAMVMD